MRHWSFTTSFLTASPSSFPLHVSAHAWCFPHTHLASSCSAWTSILLFTWQNILILFFKVKFFLLLRKNYAVSPGHSILSFFKMCHLGSLFWSLSSLGESNHLSLLLSIFYHSAASLSICIPISPTGLRGDRVRGHGIFISAFHTSD